MRKIFLILLTIGFTGMLLAQTPSPNNNERQKLIREVEQKLEESLVLEFLRKCNVKIEKSIKDNKPLSPLEYSAYSLSLKKWLKYRWFIADTGLSKKWLGKIYDLLNYMGKIQRYIKIAKFNGQANTAKFKQAEKYLNVAHQRFFELMKKTVRVSKKVRQKEQFAKDMWQKAMRKKYNIKEGSWYSVF